VISKIYKKLAKGGGKLKYLSILIEQFEYFRYVLNKSVLICPSLKQTRVESALAYLLPFVSSVNNRPCREP
jgi:hypothetical protein